MYYKEKTYRIKTILKNFGSVNYITGRWSVVGGFTQRPELIVVKKAN